MAGMYLWVHLKEVPDMPGQFESEIPRKVSAWAWLMPSSIVISNLIIINYYGKRASRLWGRTSRRFEVSLIASFRHTN